MAVAHYLEALDFQKEIVKIHTIFGGKNPHPNWLVGGVPCPINVDGVGAVGAINMERLNLVSSIIDQIDRLHRTGLYSRPHGDRLVLQGLALRRRAVGEVGDDLRRHSGARQRLFRREPDAAARRHHQRQPQRGAAGRSARSRRRSRSSSPIPGTNIPTRPRACIPGTASPSRTSCSGPNAKGTKTNIEAIDESGEILAGSRRRAGRATPMEVGPLARYIIGYAQNKPEFKEPIDKLLKTLGVPVTALFSTLGRTAARGLECQWAAHKLRYFQDKLMANIKAGDTSHRQCREVGAGDLADGGQGRRLHRGAARRARPLDQDQGRQDRQLPVRGAHHLERQPARPARQYRRLRGRAARHPDGRPEPAAGNPAHAALVRSLPGLLDPRDERGRPGNEPRCRCADDCDGAAVHAAAPD